MELPKIFTDTVGELKWTTETYIETGFAFIDARWEKDRILLHKPMVSKYMRAVAKELKRPYIRAETWEVDKEGWQVHLVFPRQLRLMPLIAPLMLVAVPGGRYHRQNADAPITYFDYVTIRTFTIFDRELFDQWFASVQTSPECRKVLKLPPLPSEVTKRAA